MRYVPGTSKGGSEGEGTMANNSSEKLNPEGMFTAGSIGVEAARHPVPVK